MAHRPVSSASDQRAQQTSEHTRLALVRAAMKLFGAYGFDATSTREIAALAGANVASITYHFGGKEGLRAACADHIVETLRAIGAPLTADSFSPDQMTPEQATTHLVRAFDTMVSFILATPEAEEMTLFILRELARPTSALDAIYEGVFKPAHERMCTLWARATGEDPDSDQTMLTIFTQIGQIVYFKVGRAAVMRRMGWDVIDEDKAALISDIVRANVNAIIASRRRI
jgi:AcrR family transcriptional regulator